MYHNYVYDDVSQALPNLLGSIIHNGAEVGSRDGRTLELTHTGVTYTNPRHREVLVEGRRPNLAAQIAETMWVLSGRSDVEWLGNYLPRAKDFSDDGVYWRAGYGPRLRAWESGGKRNPVDQLDYVVETLRNNPSSRQAVMSIWDPSVDTYPGKDIPCNDWLHFLCREGRLDLHVAVRSNDVWWGHSGINAFEWSVLLEIVAVMCGFEVGSLHFAISSLHLYTERHYTRAMKVSKADSWAAQGLFDSPRFNDTGIDDVDALDYLFAEWFKVEEAIRTGSTLASQWIDEFPEPMLKSWLRVLQWWWSSDTDYLAQLTGTRLYVATGYSVQPSVESGHMVPVESKFLDHVYALHQQKAQAYGDSWKRRGEMLGIMANIARKIDRFGRPDIEDESATDTAIDLMVYLAMYRWYLTDCGFISPIPATEWTEPFSDNVVEPTRGLFLHLDQIIPDSKEPFNFGESESYLAAQFDRLEPLAHECNPNRVFMVDAMLMDAFVLARARYEA